MLYFVKKEIHFLFKGGRGEPAGRGVKCETERTDDFTTICRYQSFINYANGRKGRNGNNGDS